MNTVLVTFGFTCDNSQLALDEISQQIRNLKLDPGEPVITGASEPSEREDDWFDDVVFAIKTNVGSDLSREKNKRAD